jgi:hypothetical protein
MHEGERCAVNIAQREERRARTKRKGGQDWDWSCRARREHRHATLPCKGEVRN